MKKIVLIGNASSKPSRQDLLQTIRQSDVCIAADGGANLCFEWEILPDIVLGDFDSIKPSVLKFFQKKTVCIRYPRDKNKTDLELAIQTIHRKWGPYHSVNIFSWADEQVDYTLGFLWSIAESPFRFSLKLHGGEIFILNRFYPKLTLHKKNVSFVRSVTVQSVTVSVFPLKVPVSLYTKGLRWELCWNHEDHFKISQSNEISASQATIDLTNGSAFVLIKKALLRKLKV